MGRHPSAQISWSLAVGLWLATFLLGSPPASENLRAQANSGGRANIRIVWSDRGIKQAGEADSKGAVASRSTVPCSRRSDCVLVVAPPEMPSTEDAVKRQVDQIAGRISTAVAAARRRGLGSVEVLTVSRVELADHLFDNSRERDAEALTMNVGAAISKVKRSANAEVVAYFGSDGTRTYASQALRMTEAGANPIDRAVLIDGRAFGDDSRWACVVTPACTLIISEGDIPALDRIANGSVARQVADAAGYNLIREQFGDAVAERGNTRLLRVNRSGYQFLTSHVRSMNRNERILVKEYRGGNEWTDEVPMTDLDLLAESLRPRSESSVLARTQTTSTTLLDSQIDFREFLHGP